VDKETDATERPTHVDRYAGVGNSNNNNYYYYHHYYYYYYNSSITVTNQDAFN